jgi:hypothetical protein
LEAEFIMNKRKILHIALGFIATACFIAAGLSLNLGQNNTIPAASQNFESAYTQPSPAEIFDFGDNKNHQILLALANTPAQDYTLTTVSLDAPLTPQQIAMCTHTGVPVVSPPASVVASKTQPAASPFWERVTAWLTQSTKDSYFVTLWSPLDTSDAYVLVSGDGPSAPVVCASPVDEGV